MASVLLCGSKFLVLPPSTYKALKEFHVEDARRLTGMRPRKVKGYMVGLPSLRRRPQQSAPPDPVFEKWLTSVYDVF